MTIHISACLPFRVGDLITYLGKHYKVKQSNTFEVAFKNGMVFIPRGELVKQTAAERDGSWIRAGSWAEFVRRFDPISAEDIESKGRFDTKYLLSSGPLLSCPHEHIWTVIDGDDGHSLYAVQGWYVVDRLGYIIARNPRAEAGDYKAFLF